MITVTVRLFSEMKRHGPDGRDRFTLELAAGATVGDVRKRLNIPADTPRIVLQDGRPTTDDTPLLPDAVLVVFPAVSGG